MANTVVKTDAEWRRELTPEQYRVLRRQGTERTFTGEDNATQEKGAFRCAGCGRALFRSAEKFDSATGWPSFWAPAEEGAVETETDRSRGMVRTGVTCADCGGHLGRLFDDGPPPTGPRYCINSAALRLDNEP